MAPMSNHNESDPWQRFAAKGRMHRWRIGVPDIPCQVASPQSLTPLLRAPQPYRHSMLVASTVGHRSYALKIHRRMVRRDSRYAFPG
jgi:hypothetical protein